jgi:hypothetical protein
MPVPACRQSYNLTGRDGLVTIKPPGTSACLLDKTDFPAGASITVPANSDFRIGDPVTFAEKGIAVLSAPLTEGTTYYIKARPSPTTVQISATIGGAAITLTGSGGTGGANTPGSGNHIEMSFASANAMCNLDSIELSLTVNEIDNTSLPCEPADSSATQMIEFRSYQAGYADGTGSFVVKLTDDLDSFTNRLIQGVFNRQQTPGQISAYFSAVKATSGTAVDDTKSQRMEFPVMLLGVSGSISQDDDVTRVTINYRMAGRPTNILGLVSP